MVSNEKLKTREWSVLFQQVAVNAANQWNSNNNVLLVVETTYPQELAEIRQIVGDMSLLIRNQSTRW